MQIESELTFQGLEHSDAVAAAVQRWIARLEKVDDRITRCSVVVTLPHKHHRHGREFHVGVVLEIPGIEIATTHIGNADIYVAVADAFRATRRQLHERLELQRRFVRSASAAV